MFQSATALDGATPRTGSARTRRIIARTTGRSHGAISRLIDPGDLGEILKPFVFLDYFDENRARMPPFGFHPHSGIATLTYVAQGAFRYEDTSGAVGLLEGGGVEWIHAGSGVWHRAQAATNEPLHGFQLWLALPPHLELGPASSRYLPVGELPVAGPARVLLGRYQSASSAIEPPSPVNYLAVSLRPGERWVYQPPPEHTVLWVAVSKGAVSTTERIEQGELVAFEPSLRAVEFAAEGEVEFVLGSAKPHPYQLTVGPSSVHTAPAALSKGQRHIAEIGASLQRAGRI